MQIDASEIESYLGFVTVCWFDDHDTATENLDEIDPLIFSIRTFARKRGELDELRAALAYLMKHPEIDCRQLAGPRYGFNDNEMRNIITHVLEQIPCEVDESSIDSGQITITGLK